MARPAQPSLPVEMAHLEALAEAGLEGVQARVACRVEVDGQALPVHVFTLGNADPRCPAFGVFGGVHGLERIGAEVAIAWLRNLVARLPWDESLQRLLDGTRLLVMPLVNPGGLWRGTRANPAGVDLMRNAPVDCPAGAPPLLGGQRLSAALPWYRGAAGAPMEPEALALCDAVERELLGRPLAIALDCHSGFGVRDRLWFPHAHTPQPIEHLPELERLGTLLDEALPHHPYLFEPQSRQYLAHGDLWDHLYLRAAARADGTLLPLTLEMGSWLWVKKNPRQAFSRHGIFNPLIEHRQQRVLRRHLSLLDFMMRAAFSQRRWALPAAQRDAWRTRALQRWYEGLR
ncbi:MAG: DUF2817 domain-containing protein [Piscinibacter sp.]|nr:DUF2817 domain-containing protein [Piscinibacter sp.]